MDQGEYIVLIKKCTCGYFPITWHFYCPRCKAEVFTCSMKTYDEWVLDENLRRMGKGMGKGKILRNSQGKAGSAYQP